MVRLALFGAGGKMGTRIRERLKGNDQYDLFYVETNETAKERMRNEGLKLSTAQEAAESADIVILAVPDVKMGQAAQQVVPIMKPGAQLILLDPAAAYYDLLPLRDDLSYFVSHPCHPPVFNDETTLEAKRDYFGGVKAKQSIVCALIQGTQEDYLQGERVARDIYAPILRSHRITVEQMAMLEPTLVETIAAPAVLLLKEAVDEAVSRGVPYEAAIDFMMGHINIELAIAFGVAGNPFSDAAMVAIEYGRRHVIKENWRSLFEEESVRDQVRTMLNL